MIRQTYTLGATIIASVFVSGWDADADVTVLAVAVSARNAPHCGAERSAGSRGPRRVVWLERPNLLELNPYYWAEHFADGDTWPWSAVHVMSVSVDRAVVSGRLSWDTSPCRECSCCRPMWYFRWLPSPAAVDRCASSARGAPRGEVPRS